VKEHSALSSQPSANFEIPNEVRDPYDHKDFGAELDALCRSGDKLVW